MSSAFCVRCGSGKDRPWNSCGQCGLDPSSDESLLIRSVYLSLGRYEDPDEQERYRPELERLAGIVRAGGEIAYDPGELARLAEQKAMVESVSTGTLHVAPPSFDTLLYCPPSPVRINISTSPFLSSMHAGSHDPSPGFTRCDSRHVAPSSSER